MHPAKPSDPTSRDVNSSDPPAGQASGHRLGAGLRLLLASGDSEQPQVVLPQGLPLRLLDGAPAPAVTPATSSRLAFGDTSRDASLLSERRWGVVVPGNDLLRGPLLSAVEPLLSLRARQQGLDLPTLLRSLVYSVPADPELPLARAVDWYRRALLEEDLADEQRKTELERPDYLLVLGDLHQVPETVVQVLVSYGHFVGRLAFSDESGGPRLADYRRYAEKLVAAADPGGRVPDDEDDLDDAEARAAAGASPISLTPGDAQGLRRARLLYVRDGSEATELANELLVRPLLSRLSLAGRKGAPRDLNPAAATALTSSDDLLQAASQLPASLLFTVGHGYGGPRAGFATPVEQRRQQGALSFPSSGSRRSASGRRLSADDLRAASVPFVAGGIWFMLACYGAGTPSESQFYHWLASRSDQLDDEARWVLRSLPAPAQRLPGSRPFVAALPQAALAQPDGPLAIVGHLDLAWSYSFVDAGEGDDGSPDAELQRGDYDHFETFVRSLMRKTRLGPAFASLTSKRRSAEQSLLRRYDSRRRAQLRPDAAASPSARDADAALRRHWLTRQDLVGYVILGDPAVRLPVAAIPRRALQPAAVSTAVTAPPAAATAPPAAPTTATAAASLVDAHGSAGVGELGAMGSEIDLRALEEAIARWTLGAADAASLARPLGLTGAQLESLAARYHQAGRAALVAGFGAS